MTDLPDDELLIAYLDGELATGQAEILEARLDQEPGLRDRLQHLAATTRLVRESFDPVLREPVPERLLKAASERPPGAEIVPFRAQAGAGWRIILQRRWAGLTAAACVSALVVGGSLGYFAGHAPQQDTGVLQNIAGAHNLIIQRASAGESSVFDVIPGSEKKLPSDVRVPDMKIWGLSFQGGRMLVEDGKPAYQFFYAADSKSLGPITVTVWKTQLSDTEPTFVRRENLNVMYWRHDGHGYAIMGDANKGFMRNMSQGIAWQLHAG